MSPSRRRTGMGDLKPTPVVELEIPKTVDKLVEILEPELTHLRILPSARKSCKDYGKKYHDEVEAALRCLDAVGEARNAGGGRLSMSVNDWVNRYKVTHKGVPRFKAKESETTWKTYRK